MVYHVRSALIPQARARIRMCFSWFSSWYVLSWWEFLVLRIYKFKNRSFFHSEISILRRCRHTVHLIIIGENQFTVCLPILLSVFFLHISNTFICQFGLRFIVYVTMLITCDVSDQKYYQANRRAFRIFILLQCNIRLKSQNHLVWSCIRTTYNHPNIWFDSLLEYQTR